MFGLRKRWYIRIEDRNGGVCLFGPFPESEIDQRLNDEFADLEAEDLSNVDGIRRSDREMRDLYINPPESWDNAVKEIQSWHVRLGTEDLPDDSVHSGAQE